MIFHFLVKFGECVPMPCLLNNTQSKYLSTQYVCVCGEIDSVCRNSSIILSASQSGSFPTNNPR